jgi:hypothetical protein
LPGCADGISGSIIDLNGHEALYFVFQYNIKRGAPRTIYPDEDASLILKNTIIERMAIFSTLLIS